MKSLLITIYIFFTASINLHAQINPLGVYLEIDGKINFWYFEANRNGQVNDTIIITYNNEKEITDLRNLKYDLLTFVESPRTIWTSPCNLDPSRINDTIEPEPINNINYLSPIISFSIEPFVLNDTIILENKNSSVVKNNYFADDIRGVGLNDSTIAVVKNILIKYINQYYNSYPSIDNREKLRYQLSKPDTIINHKAVYDYLVDLFIVHDFDSNQNLSRVIGYHWDYGIEIDSLKYDQLNRLIYFSRESIGSIQQQYFFTYDKYSRVTQVKNYYSTVGVNADRPSYTKSDIYTMKFTYNKSGKLNSKSYLQKDGKWITSNFEIKNK
jgi:hypothetical protein